ncbi:uncharacterized protein LOC128216716 [Mya arenaria]|uniref:uncharacterized protein LOC128216716 n=1 Tax=Mya arenaria TaxID=6604 RepID=UPI0022DF10E0|nr:uncharacterized protein LOC128216716 [Mya arenaria]XP_052779322.1 uncharacterized protein LOC128216716 [Mya arenaria]XP_052779323.1 uncharacterized protein LOC128216716 [Mya arenaria]XP_052779324.1 uncharacterized protein LOC128216716 [Mya arenaria]
MRDMLAGFSVLILVSVWPHCDAETVYMDRYGDCFHDGPIEVEESYTILSQGGEAYDTLTCQMTFKADKGSRLCLTFRSIRIDNCGVNLHVFSKESSNDKVLGSYGCKMADTPNSVCSDDRYMTILMKKRELSHEGYNFKLELRIYSEGDAFTDGVDAFIVSIGIIVGIVVSVIVLVVLAAVIIVCCCCKNRQSGFYRQKSAASGRTGTTDVILEPTAPPLPEDPPAYADIPPPYTSLPQGGDDDPQSSQPSPETQHMLPHTEGKDVV